MPTGFCSPPPDWGEADICSESLGHWVHTPRRHQSGGRWQSRRLTLNIEHANYPVGSGSCKNNCSQWGWTATQNMHFHTLCVSLAIPSPILFSSFVLVFSLYSSAQMRWRAPFCSKSIFAIKNRHVHTSLVPLLLSFWYKTLFGDQVQQSVRPTDGKLCSVNKDDEGPVGFDVLSYVSAWGQSLPQLYVCYKQYTSCCVIPKSMSQIIAFHPYSTMCHGIELLSLKLKPLHNNSIC